MKKTILDALKAKFVGVSEAILDRVATKLARTVVTAEQVATAVEGVTIQQVIESYGDSRATEAQQTAVHTYETKYGLKDGQKIDGGGSGQQTTTTTVQTETQPAGGGDIAAQIAAAVSAAVKPLTDEIAALKTGRVTETRRQQLNAVIGKLTDENVRKAYERTPIENLSDEEFTTLLGEVSTEVEGICSATAAKGAVFGKPAAQSGSNQGGALTKEQEEAIAHRENTPSSGGQPF